MRCRPSVRVNGQFKTAGGTYGGTQLLARGFGAESTLRQLQSARPCAEWRQLAVLDAEGSRSAATGAMGLGIVAMKPGDNCIAAGNLLANDGIPAAMVDAFERLHANSLALRLLGALEAGAVAGGEAGTVHSAGFCVYGRRVWPVAELRVDWSDAPITDLLALWQRYEPQMNDYVMRATRPDQAPAYGVPGDLGR
jgi:uncharacterized Ntn-hydrolase superfamily protein